MSGISGGPFNSTIAITREQACRSREAFQLANNGCALHRAAPQTGEAPNSRCCIYPAQPWAWSHKKVPYFFLGVGSRRLSKTMIGQHGGCAQLWNASCSALPRLLPLRCALAVSTRDMRAVGDLAG
jgi:hypothetical protein